ncbi:MAG: hypothetical protein IPM53_09500 [Anaerolineaceae bacterium]|nr:hypothetical protein [Anaerolineaceae bacterium]
MSFEWRTDEDEGWPEEGKPKQTAVPQPFLRRRWRFLLGVLVGITAVWLAVQWQINQRVATATADVETELLATHNFVLQTAVSRDEDLFRANLSGRNPGWGEVQTTLLNEGLLLDRPMLGWQHQPAADRLTREDVTFVVSPDLQAVELLYPQGYAITRPDGVTKTVTLMQTAVYRAGNTRWLFSPPLEDFWGEWMTQNEGALSLAFPERDQAVAARLAVDLAALLEQMCTGLDDLQCGSDLHVHLRLDNDPESLIAINDVETILKSGLRLELPTPTLVGLPTDEASYDVLYRAYGVELATAVLAHQTEYDCCRHELFFRALRDYQLAQLGLHAWPLNEVMYGQILSGGFDGNMLSHWTRRWEEAPPQFLQVWVVEDQDPIWKQVYMLVAYLGEQETAVSPTEMMRLMNRNSYHGWMSEVLQGSYNQALFPTQFLQHIYDQSQGDQQAKPPIPLPDGAITVVCTDFQFSEDSRVYAYDLATELWREKLSDLELPPSAYIHTEDGHHFVVNESSYEVPLVTNKYYLATEEQIVFLEETAVELGEDHFIYYDFLMLETGSKLLRYEYNQGDIQSTLRALDCPTADCPEFQASGFLTFSPDGAHAIEHMPIGETEDSIAIVESMFETTLVSLEGDLRRPIAEKGMVYWLSNEQYGFLQAAEDGWVFTAATLTDPVMRPFLYESDLVAELDGVDTLSLNNVYTVPGSQNLILQAQALPENETTYLFQLRPTDDRASIQQVELLWSGSFSWVRGASPDGRYLVLAESNYTSSSNETSYRLLDLETLELSEPILSRGLWAGYGISWSPDGQWFVQSTENYLLLHAPAYEYQFYIPYGLGDCLQVLLSVDE